MKYPTEHSENCPYTMISNETIDDRNLSPADLGVLVKAMRYKDDGNFSIKGMQNSWGKCKGTIETAIKHLEDLGYIVSKPQGHLTNGAWSKDTLDFYEKPMPKSAYRQNGQTDKTQPQTAQQSNKDLLTTNTLTTENPINHSNPLPNEIDRSEMTKRIKANIDYETLCNRNLGCQDEINNLIAIAVDTILTTESQVWVEKQYKSAECVRSVLLKLDLDLMQYVLTSIKEYPKKINNYESFALTTMFKAHKTDALKVRNDVSVDMADADYVMEESY